MKHKPFVRRKALALLACWCGVRLVLRVSGAEAPAAGPEGAWKELLTAKEAFHDLEPSSLKPQDFDRFLVEYGQKAGALADQFRDYQQHYTNSIHLDEAWSVWMEFLNLAAHGNPTRKAELERVEQRCLEDPKLETSRRERIRHNQTERTEDLEQREKLVRQVQADLKGQTEYFCQSLLEIAESSDYPHSRDLVEEVLKLTEERAGLSYFRGEAQQLKARLDRIGRPLQLKFTALDGAEVNVEKLRGKVVLLEFWATWCPPCVGGIPKIQSAWQALHPAGLEVIALSYDTERKRLATFVKNHALPWPQFFAPEGKDAPLIKAFGQPGPPAYWLIDRQGVLVDVNAHHDLERKVRALLFRTGRASTDPFPATEAIHEDP